MGHGQNLESLAWWQDFKGIKPKQKVDSPCVHIVLAGQDAESENSRLGGDHSELVSLTWWSRAFLMSSKVGKAAWSILAKTQAILLYSLATKRALKQCSRTMSFIHSVSMVPTWHQCWHIAVCRLWYSAPRRVLPWHQSEQQKDWPKVHFPPNSVCQRFTEIPLLPRAYGMVDAAGSGRNPPGHSTHH